MSDFRRRSYSMIAAFILLCGTAFAQGGNSSVIRRGSAGEIQYSTFGSGSGSFETAGTLMTSSGSMLVSSSSGWVTVDPGAETRSINSPRVTLAQVKLSRKPIPASSLATAGYMKLAKAISLKSPAVDYSEMGEILADHGFQVYDFAKVDNYLYHEALKQGAQMRWVWKAMRDVDMKNAAEAGAWGTIEGMGRLSSSGSVYARAIPERVLEKVECLLGEMPDAIFFVSDYEVVKPDPFLAVSTKRMLQDHKIFIVDQWDEPGFKDSPKPIVEPVSSPIPVRMAQSKNGR